MKLFTVGVFAFTFPLAVISVSVKAVPLTSYGASIDLSSPACITFGDAVSCSAPLLNVLAGQDQNTKVADGGYVLPTPQGALESYIVVGAGGGVQGNDDIDPTIGAVEDGFKSNDVTNDAYFATGTTGTTAGNLSDPNNNNLLAPQDALGTWDISIDWLINALTFGAGRHDLMIGFDYNQPQNTTTSLDFWSLITVRDTIGDADHPFDPLNPLADINFEILNNNPAGLTNTTFAEFTSSKTFDSKPASTDFGTVNGVTCIDTDGSELIGILPIPGGQCPAGYETAVDNAQSTADTEIFTFLPELNAMLESYLLAGYDTLSTRVLLGCFGGTPAGSFNPGIGYLSDEGTTDNCGGGGFADIFLLAGDLTEVPPEVPEPPVLALIGVAAAGLFWRRRSTRKTPAIPLGLGSAKDQ